MTNFTMFFSINLKKFFYKLDCQESSYTSISVEDQSSWRPKKALKAGEFTVDILPIVQRKDGYAIVILSTKKVYKWKMNLMIINKFYSFL